MKYKCWAVREGKESDPTWSERDAKLQALSDIMTPIWTEGHQTLTAFVARAVQLLNPHFKAVVQHPEVIWYKDDHQPDCRFKTVCCNQTELTLVDDGDMPIKAQISTDILLSDL